MRVAVVQLDCHPAAVRGSSDLLEDPLFAGKDETLPTPDAVAEVLVQPIRALRTRVRETYCAQLLRKATAILEACRGWGVQLVVFPEYSIPWQILEGVAAASGEMVVVAGTHSVTRAAHKDRVYQRLGGVTPPALEAVAPVLHHGKLLALTSKMHAAKPERGALRESERWSTIELPPDLGLPSPLGVVICLDFLVAPGAEPDTLTRDKLQQARLLAVPSWTPTHTLREFEAAAWVSAARGRTPVLYANVTANGGSTIYVDKDYGQEAGQFPRQIGRLDAGDEGVVVVDVDLSDQRRGTLTQFLDRQIVTPIAQASLVYRSHPAGAAYAAWLEAQAPALANGDDGMDDVIAAIETDAAILRAAGALPGAAARGLRLRSLLHYPEGLNSIEDVACRVREVVLPADVVPHRFVRAAMARGAGQAIDDLLLHGDLRGPASGDPRVVAARARATRSDHVSDHIAEFVALGSVGAEGDAAALAGRARCRSRCSPRAHRLPMSSSSRRRRRCCRRGRPMRSHGHSAARSSPLNAAPSCGRAWISRASARSMHCASRSGSWGERSRMGTMGLSSAASSSV
jgi:predicted amidohydrolase